MELSFNELELEGVLLDNICLKVLESIAANKKTEAQNIYTDDIFGKVSYKIIGETIEISFGNHPNKINIYKNPVVFKNDKNEEIYKAFNEDLLNDALRISSDYYDFYAKGKKIEQIDVVKEKITEIIWIKKNPINYEIFEPLNNKNDIPKEKFVTISTNQIIPENIESLNLNRDENIIVIIDKREQFIQEINKFLNSNDAVLKIYGWDGIGKSLPFIYLQSLISKYKIVYFNLKEIKEKGYSKQIDFFKKQLMMYFSQKNSNINDKEKLNKQNYGRYIDLIKSLDEKIKGSKIPVDFWMLLGFIIEKKKLKNVLYILDQYKEENDKKNNLDNSENVIIGQKIDAKILISFSVKDGKVKYDLSNILKGLVISDKNEIKGIDTEGKDEIEKFCESYEENINYFEETDKNDTSKMDDEAFDEIMAFNFSDNSNNKKSDEQKFFHFGNIKKKKEKIKIIYINKLVSAKYLQDDKNKDLLKKMDSFDYNPKYFYKLMQLKKNNPLFSLEELNQGFLKLNYEQISKNIIKFYKGYCLKTLNEFFEKAIVKYLIILLDLIKNQKQLTLNELIYYLEYFPLKFIKILKVEEDNDNKNNDYIILNKDINNFKFKLDFVFPFIEIVIRKYIYDTGIIGNLNFSHLSPSGMGSLLEIEILKSLMDEKNSFIKCSHRTVWGFVKFEENEKNISETIDIYNFNKLILDNGKHPLDNIHSAYYITPYNPNNEYLDSLLLIPNPFNNDNEKNYSLVSIQMTIKKEKIYDLEEYHKSTEIASTIMEKTYDIKIVNKYFIFILAKEYDNVSTQINLIKKHISYIFYSTNDNFFYFDENRQIKGINDLLKKEFKIRNENDFIQKEFLYNKYTRLKELNILLNKKRKIDNIRINKNLFSFARKKIFGDFPLSDIKLVKKDIITQIRKIDLFENKKFIVEFVFTIPFSEINNINVYQNLLGIFAFSGSLYYFYNNENIKNLYTSNKKKDNNTQDIILYIFKKSYIGLKENIHDYMKKKEESKTIKDLIQSNIYKPSDVFVYSIYEIDKSIK